MSENFTKAVLTRQGRKAVKGETGDLTDVEIRRKGLKRLLRNVGGGAIAAAGAVFVLAHGLAGQEKFSEGVVASDKASAPKVGSQLPGTPGASAEAPVDQAATSTTEEGTSTEAQVATTVGETPAPPPTEGDWTPTPGVSAASPSPEGGVSAQPEQPQTGGVEAGNPTPPVGGVSSK